MSNKFLELLALQVAKYFEKKFGIFWKQFSYYWNLGTMGLGNWYINAIYDRGIILVIDPYRK